MISKISILFLLFESGVDSIASLFGCCIIPLAVIILVLYFLDKSAKEERAKRQAIISVQKQELEQAKKKYYQTLERLKTNPTNADLKQATLSFGRSYSELSRQFQSGDKTVTIFDELALMNDINAACAAATSPVNTSTTEIHSVEERLSKLQDLKEKNLISEEEYNTRRQKILDEI